MADYSLSRRVSWSSEHHIDLVETRAELMQHKEDLWYDKRDFVIFKEDAVTELKQCMDRYQIADVSDAMLLLYHGCL